MTAAVLPAAPAAAPAPARPSRPAADGDAFEQVLRSQAGPADEPGAADPTGEDHRDAGADQPGDPAAAVVPEPAPEPVVVPEAVVVPTLPLAAPLQPAVTSAGITPPTDGRQPATATGTITAAIAPAGGQEPTTVSAPAAATPPTGDREPTTVSAPLAPGAPVPSTTPTPAGGGDPSRTGEPVAPTVTVVGTPTAGAENPADSGAAQAVPMADDGSRPDAPSAPLQAVAQPAATTPAVPVAPSAPAAPAAVPAPLHTQVVTAVGPLLTGPDGTHELTVRLDPDGLGAVHVRLTVAGDEVRMHLVAADAATREALRDGLGQLRTQLEDVGLRATHLDVAADADHRQQAGPGAEDRHRATGTADRPGTRHGPAPPAAQHPAPATHRPDTRLDLRI